MTQNLKVMRVLIIDLILQPSGWLATKMIYQNSFFFIGTIKFKPVELEMESAFKLTIVSCLFCALHSFPISQTNLYTTSADPSTNLITDTYIEDESGTIMLYAIIVSNSKLDLKIEKVNITASPPVLLYSYSKTFTAAITKPVITFFTNTFGIALMEGSSGYYSRLSRALVVLKTESRTGVLAGFYLSNLAIMCFHEIDDGIYSSPESPSRSLIGTYATGTAYPQEVTLLGTQNQSLLLSFYKDFNYFFIRNITTTSSITNTFSSPTPVSLPEHGHQCAFFNNNDTVLYILQPSGLLVTANAPFTTITSTISTNITGVEQCYYDSSTNGIVTISTFFTSSNSGSTTMKLFSLESGSVTSTFISPTLYFKVSKSQTYMTMSSSNQIYFYNAVTSCPSAYFYDSASQVCRVCSTGCTTCSSSTVCTVCETGYTLLVNSCVVSTNISPASNTTIIDNTTIAANTNITGNTTIVDNTTLVDNTTIAANYTNDTSSPFVPAFNQTITNETSNSEQTYLNNVLSTFLFSMMDNRFIKIANKVPGGRRMFPFFCFLLNLDELWLYQYHERNYGEVMSQFFQGLQQLQTQKWNLLGDEKVGEVYQLFGTSKQTVERAIDTKSNYTYSTFLKIEAKGETFLIACWNFLTFNLIFVLVLYLLLRIGFSLLFQYRISIFLRAFSFAMYLVPLLLDGNLQYFFFLMFGQGYLAFSLNPKDKGFTILGYILSFIVLWLSVISCFFAYYLSRKLSKYILDNWRTRIHGLLSYSLSNAVRMIVFGAIHSLLRFDYLLQLSTLLVAEVLFILFLLYTLKSWKAHRVEFKVWFGLFFAFLRVLLVMVLLLQQGKEVVEARSEVFYLLEDILLVILSVYMVAFYLGTGMEIIYQVVELIKRKNLWKRKDKEQRRKEKEERRNTNNTVARKQKIQTKVDSKPKKTKVKAHTKIAKKVTFSPEDPIKRQVVLLPQKTIKTAKSQMKWMVVSRTY